MNTDISLELTEKPDILMGLLFDAYSWFDESLQCLMQAQNIPPLSRSQSMVMICLVGGSSRPSELARKLRISRQAMQKNLAEMEAKGYLHLKPDLQDRRAKHVCLSEAGKQRQHSARVHLRILEAELTSKIGSRNVAALRKALQADWGNPES